MPDRLAWWIMDLAWRHDHVTLLARQTDAYAVWAAMRWPIHPHFLDGWRPARYV